MQKPNFIKNVMIPIIPSELVEFKSKTISTSSRPQLRYSRGILYPWNKIAKAVDIMLIVINVISWKYRVRNRLTMVGWVTVAVGSHLPLSRSIFTRLGNEAAVDWDFGMMNLCYDGLPARPGPVGVCESWFTALLSDCPNGIVLLSNCSSRLA